MIPQIAKAATDEPTDDQTISLPIVSIWPNQKMDVKIVHKSVIDEFERGHNDDDAESTMCVTSQFAQVPRFVGM